jgi:hypothetical protein
MVADVVGAQLGQYVTVSAFAQTAYLFAHHLERGLEAMPIANAPSLSGVI